MISKKEVEKVAQLARLGLAQAEINKFQKELTKILDYIDQLKEVDISGVEPTSHSVFVENIMRDDEFQTSNFRLQVAKNLLDLAPETKNGYLKVKSIL